MTTTSGDNPPATEAAPANPPPGFEDYAGDVQVANGRPPPWLKYLPYVGIILSLGYYLHVRAFDTVNLVFAGLFALWTIYTPIAQKRGWFFIPM